MAERNLPVQLDALDAALAAAEDDFLRMQIRDTAKAAQAAAEVLRRNDIQVRASLLVNDAERVLALNNPSAGRGRPKANGHKSSLDLNFSDENERRHFAWVIQAARQAHADLPDDVYEGIKVDHREHGQPLTRKRLIQAARVIRNEQNKPKVEEVQKARIKRERESDEEKDGIIKSKDAEIDRLHDRLVKAEEQVALALTDDVSKKFEQYWHCLKVAEQQIAEWQAKYEEQRMSASYWRKRCKKLESEGRVA